MSRFWSTRPVPVGEAVLVPSRGFYVSEDHTLASSFNHFIHHLFRPCGNITEKKHREIQQVQPKIMSFLQDFFFFIFPGQNILVKKEVAILGDGKVNKADLFLAFPTEHSSTLSLDVFTSLLDKYLALGKMTTPEIILALRADSELRLFRDHVVFKVYEAKDIVERDVSLHHKSASVGGGRMQQEQYTACFKDKLRIREIFVPHDMDIKVIAGDGVVGDRVSLFKDKPPCEIFAPHMEALINDLPLPLRTSFNPDFPLKHFMEFMVQKIKETDSEALSQARELVKGDVTVEGDMSRGSICFVGHLSNGQVIKVVFDEKSLFKESSRILELKNSLTQHSSRFPSVTVIDPSLLKISVPEPTKFCIALMQGYRSLWGFLTQEIISLPHDRRCTYASVFLAELAALILDLRAAGNCSDGAAASHGDIKPGNLMVDKDGNWVLIDWIPFFYTHQFTGFNPDPWRRDEHSFLTVAAWVAKTLKLELLSESEMQLSNEQIGTIVIGPLFPSPTDDVYNLEVLHALKIEKEVRLQAQEERMQAQEELRLSKEELRLSEEKLKKAEEMIKALTLKGDPVESE
eukprot:gnl/Dysnectes_brevis/2350_a2773_1437.p1 GENE.gnl/Dysnectes_brevis/2350_a2773_1437~~gnl/Dysnectes_brevis/2350_a2773_1437.p1  ORF type:complete len:574 (-),score=73.26 gnl/Dysnectes_brevis/2350_a2773_1437:172-1893(-)